MELILQRPQKKESVKKYSVMYVDDEPVNLRIFQHAFKRDYNVLTASSGFEALEMLSENKVDLIITDQQMPKMSGVDLLAKIVPKHPNIIRMIMTGFSDIGAIIRAVNEFGLDKYLVKPWDRDQLKAEFDKALEKKESEKTAPKTADVGDSMLKLNESILPSDKDLKELISDSFVLFDNNADNSYGYWFGEKQGKLAMACFDIGDNVNVSLAVKSYISLSLSEIVYKSDKLDSAEILGKLYVKIRNKFEGNDAPMKPMDISMAIIDLNSKEISYSGSNQSMYYFDTEGKLQMLNGDKEAYHIVENNNPKLSVHTANGVTKAYFISKNMVNQIIPSNDSSTEGVSFLQYMRGMTDASMNEQFEKITKQLSGESSKCMIGVKLK
ncbi:response regulator [Reichenbachiella ulvae]|uniref:Response regulator n=1 Tax=Reichenbachiella ulvae TaxID=2980104 RepID=A0ABT3CQ44_9BACT|nr:response regulator [Reichenbachiella ulvae]MCV9385821.1 response regulator [Reichenbachiella ulvae]